MSWFRSRRSKASNTPVPHKKSNSEPQFVTKLDEPPNWAPRKKRPSTKSRRLRTRRMLAETLHARSLLAANVFDDSLAEDWGNWSWDSTVDFAESSTVHEGAAAISVRNDQSWGAFYLGNSNQVAVDGDDTLNFAIHGGTEAPPLQLFVTTPDGRWIDAGSVAAAQDSWLDISIPLNSLGESITALDGIVLQDFSGTPSAPYFVDTIHIGESNSSDPGDDNPGSGTGGGQYVSALFVDDFVNDWQSWSWNTSVDTNTSVVFEGSHSLQVSYSGAYAGLYFGRNDALTTQDFDSVEFAIHGGTGGQDVNVFVLDADGSYLPAASLTLEAGNWSEHAVNLWEIGDPSRFSGLVFQDAGGGNSTPFYVDEVVLTSVGEPDPQTSTGPSITIDPNVIHGTISDDIYGLNFADPQLAADIGLTVDRWGGNSTTRYNYEIDTFNTASDWFFENIANEVDDESALPAGNAADQFVAANQNRGSDSIITLNTLGWIPKSRDKVGGFSVEKYGEQQEVDPWLPGYGNGVRPDGSYITGNDPYDTSIPSDEAFAQQWITHLQSQFGTAADGGVQYYALDNEPMLWHYTHRDVHPEPASYDEVLSKGVSYAGAIKDIDPDAQVLGPTVFGWTAYFYSALDAAAGGAWWENPMDRNANGGKPFVPWYLEQMAAAEEEQGRRLLDYLDIHYYPQNDGITLTKDGGSAELQATRNRSTRSLWDPDYVDETWIDDTVMLLPRMRDWIDENYPDTKLAITEYNFGAIDHYTGATAQAEVLGLFGREG
ncbi:MAG: glycoside hydrolase family 44 protein, partial [Planctomycetota bacterium]